MGTRVFDRLNETVSSMPIIIPTRVGTRAKRLILRFVLGDHPHACGDKPLHYFFRAISTGSSPRVWGQGMTTSTMPLKIGIIPTRVGTSGTPTPLSPDS